MEMNLARIKGKILLQHYIVGAACIGLGLLYIPAFVYGLFWLWVFPFVALVTLYYKAELKWAYSQICDIEDDIAKSKRAAFSFLRICLFVCTLGALPFISALSFLHYEIIQNDKIGSIDEWLFRGVLYWTPSPAANKIHEKTNLEIDYIQILCGAAVYMYYSFFSFLLFAFQDGARMHKAINNYGDGNGSKKRSAIYHDNGETLQSVASGIFILFLIVMYVMSMNEFVENQYTLEVLNSFCVVVTLGSVLLSGLINKVCSIPYGSINWRKRN